MQLQSRHASALLLELGAVPGLSDGEGFAPIHAAAQENQEAIIGRLLRAGASLDAATRSGATALPYAGQLGHVAVRVLAEAGANRDERNDRGETPLHIAVRSGHVVTGQAMCSLGFALGATAGDDIQAASPAAVLNAPESGPRNHDGFHEILDEIRRKLRKLVL
jgi:ankyrin repeat protein